MSFQPCRNVSADRILVSAVLEITVYLPQGYVSQPEAALPGLESGQS
jgi:hypothetical protein